MTLTNTDGTSGTLPNGWVADFLDVPANTLFHPFVTTLVRNAITAGVGGGNYGLTQETLRQQMAVFLLKSKYGICYMPPPCTVPAFPDVPCTNIFAAWINELVAQGITTGCGSGNFCPANPVTRQQMAVFLLKTLEAALRSSGLHGRDVHGCAVRLAVCSVDLRARGARHHGGLRQRDHLLPAGDRQPGPDGRVSREDVRAAMRRTRCDVFLGPAGPASRLRPRPRRPSRSRTRTTREPGRFARRSHDANTAAGLDTIAFNVSGAGCSGSGVCTIAPTTALPVINLSRPHRRLHAAGLLAEHHREGRDQRRPQDRRLRAVASPGSRRLPFNTPKPPARRCGASSSTAASPTDCEVWAPTATPCRVASSVSTRRGRRPSPKRPRGLCRRPLRRKRPHASAARRPRNGISFAGQTSANVLLFNPCPTPRSEGNLLGTGQHGRGGPGGPTIRRSRST